MSLEKGYKVCARIGNNPDLELYKGNSLETAMTKFLGVIREENVTVELYRYYSCFNELIISNKDSYDGKMAQ